MSEMYTHYRVVPGSEGQEHICEAHDCGARVRDSDRRAHDLTHPERALDKTLAILRAHGHVLTARPAGDRAQPTQEPSNDVAVEDVRAIAVALGLGGHARPYSAHDVVHREILPAVAVLLDAQAAVSRVEALAAEWGEYPSSPEAARARELRRALDGT